jgi:drug/metabolite transporter (DMT)-like permease
MSRAGLGTRLFILGVGLLYASGALLAKLAYQSGSNALSIMVVRTLAALVWIVIFLRITGVPLALPPKQRWRAFAMGVVLISNTFGLYYAFEKMPAPLAILNFYLFPILVAIVQTLTGRERLSGRKLLALALAFGGLALALGTGNLQPTLPGVISATIGAVGFTTLFVLTERLFPGGDSRPRTAHMLVTANLIYLGAALLTQQFAPPQTGLGWIGFLGVCITFPLAVTGFFMIIGRVPASEAAILMNIEPLTVVAGSALLFGEDLAGIQYLGALLVLAAILLVQLPARAPRSGGR